MSRLSVAVMLLVVAGLVPLTAVALGWGWYLDGPVILLLAVIGGYAAGAWLPRRWAVVVGGPAAAGAAATTRARQVRELTRLQAELDELQRIEVTATRLDEQNRIMGEVQAGLAEQIAAIAIRARGGAASGRRHVARGHRDRSPLGSGPATGDDRFPASGRGAPASRGTLGTHWPPTDVARRADACGHRCGDGHRDVGDL